MKRNQLSAVFRQSLRTSNKTHVLLAVLVFLATSAAYLYYWNSVKRNVAQDMQAAFGREIEATTVTTDMRMQRYDSVLNGAAGLVRTHEQLTQEKWTAYFEPQDIRQQLPAVQGAGFSRYVSANAVSTYLDEMHAQGRTDFTIFPEGARDHYLPVTFNAMFNGNNGRSFGYDGLTHPVRRKAITRAVETGQVSMSGGVQLVSATQSSRPAFLLYKAVYEDGRPLETVEQRWQALRGVVYLAVDMRQMFSVVMSKTTQQHFALRLYDAEAENGKANRPIFESRHFGRITAESGSVTETKLRERHGHNWRLVYTASPDLLSKNERQLPLDVLTRGIFASVFFAALVWYLLTHRERKLSRMKHQEVQHAKDELLSLASHQLRTPATVVKQYVGMLLQGYGGKLTKQQVQMLTHAYDSNERQLEIINQLLYVARLDAGRIYLRRQLMDVVKLLSSVIDDQHGAAQERKQKIIKKFPRGAVRADIDPHYMRMVFENLLSNAIKYTAPGGTITLYLQKADGMLHLTVSDTGVGIPEGNHQTIFDKFTRVENELSTDVNGSGVGLYLTREIVSLHGGTITVESIVGEGSTFTVRLPLKAAEQEKVIDQQPDATR